MQSVLMTEQQHTAKSVKNSDMERYYLKASNGNRHSALAGWEQRDPHSSRMHRGRDTITWPEILAGCVHEEAATTSNISMCNTHPAFLTAGLNPAPLSADAQGIRKNVPTCFMPSPLASRSKVEGLPHSQLRLMQIVLVNIRSRVHCPELVKVLPVVADGASGGHIAALVQPASQGIEEGRLARPRGAQEQGESAGVHDAVHGLQDCEALCGELLQVQFV